MDRTRPCVTDPELVTEPGSLPACARVFLIDLRHPSRRPPPRLDREHRSNSTNRARRRRSVDLFPYMYPYYCIIDLHIQYSRKGASD